MRRRLQKVVEDQFTGDNGKDLAQVVEAECGIDVLKYGAWGSFANWKSLFREGELRDVFDTIRFAFIKTSNYRDQNIVFRNKCARIMNEEAVGFILDDDAVVHPKVDGAFEVNRQSLLAGLSAENFSAAREHLEQVDMFLLESPMNGRGAIRSLFDVVENIFKQTFIGETHVNSRALTRCLKPILANIYSDNSQELTVAIKLFGGFENWINAVHFYRHEAGKPEPSQPTEETAIALVSQGYGHARWLLAMVDHA